VETFDVAVIGVGVMGAAAGRALATAGKKVAMLERFEIGHKKGSSHGSARIFRFSYHDPIYVAMAQEVLPLWRELEADSRESLLTRTGGIDVGAIVPQHAEALESCGASFELLAGAEVNERFPGLTLPPDETALFQSDSGVIAAERAWRAMVALAERAGADMRPHTQVTQVIPRNDHVELAVGEARIAAETVLVTAGAWARDLLAPLGIELEVVPTRETVAHFRTRLERVPVMVAWSEPAFYALPTSGLGIKAGEHIAGPPAHPDQAGGPDAASVTRLAEGVSNRFADVDPEPHLVETCFYTNTSDAHFVLERRGPVVVGSPCSGHGFKFAPLIGQRLAQLCGV
jgi:monomeric sarcosine oxidase